MAKSNLSLEIVFDGWTGYRQSIVDAVVPLSAEHLRFRPATHLRSVGEIVRHIALGPIEWFRRMGAPGSHLLASQIEAWEEDLDGNRYVIESAIDIADQSDELILWLEASRRMIDQTLKAWTVDDIQETYRHVWGGNTYAISRQWTLWRILAHDLHHGGELAILLGIQRLENFELGDLGGHVTEPLQVDQD
jgi:uncharacterized damage-inducible protein DinB